MELRDETRIEAPVEVVWDLTVDVERWPSLTPTMTSVERLDDGPMRVGSSARVKQPGMRVAVWTVTALDERSRFCWETRLLGMTMVGCHELMAEGEATRNTLTLHVHGFGSRVLGAFTGRKMARAIATENAGFRTAAEARVAH
jgi:uncharacterized membrane protein